MGLDIRRDIVDPVHRQPELVAVWLLLALIGVAIFATYLRLPADELYGVSGTGLAAGASRVVVFLGFPVSLIALATVPIAYAMTASAGRRRAAAVVSFASFALCMTIAIPGVLEEKDLDAKWVNAPAVVGVALALALTVWALRADGPAAPPWGRADTVRVAVAGALLVASVPWLAAELGFYLPGDVFLTGQIRPFAGETGSGLGPAVHFGDHHGLSGVELALAAIALLRVVPRLPGARRRLLVNVYLSVMLVYGLANGVQDFWLEQVVKRGWTDARMPSLLRPELSPAWAAMLATAAAFFLVVRASGARASRPAIITE